jgi:hypothetical protein
MACFICSARLGGDCQRALAKLKEVSAKQDGSGTTMAAEHAQATSITLKFAPVGAISGVLSAVATALELMGLAGPEEELSNVHIRETRDAPAGGIEGTEAHGKTKTVQHQYSFSRAQAKTLGGLITSMCRNGARAIEITIDK